MQGHALVLQRPYTISDRINLVVAKEIQSMLNMKLAEMYVLVLYIGVFFVVYFHLFWNKIAQYKIIRLSK